MSVDDFIDNPNAAFDLPTQPRSVTWRINPADPERTLDAATAEATWNELRDWVEWLVERYALDHRTVPPCWFLHGALVDELTALWGAWQIAYSPMASPADPANWMQILANTRARLAEWTSRRGCRPDDHRPEKPQVNPSTARGWESHIRSEAVRRCDDARATFSTG